MMLVVLLATVLCVATPIKIWNNARIEHRLQEQEKLLLAAKIEALANQINPHFLFNTLTSISSLIRTQPDTARMLITKLSGLLRRLMRSTDHFVTLREELESIDEYLDIEVVRFGPQLKVVKRDQRRHARRHRPEHDPAAAGRELDQARPGPQGRRRPHHHHARALRDGHTIIEVHDDGLGMTEERLEQALGGGIGLSNVNERLRTIYGAHYQLKLTSVPGQGTCASVEIPETRRARAGDGVRWICARSWSTTSSWRGTSSAICSARSAASRCIGQAGNGVEALTRDRAAAARRRVSRRPDARADGFRGGAADGRRAGGVAHHLRHRLRSARDRGVRGQRGRLPAEAGRPGAARGRASSAPGGGVATTGDRTGGTAAGVDQASQLEKIVQLVAERQSRRERLAIKVGERFLLVQAEEIIYASLADEGITVVTSQHVGTSNYRTLDELQDAARPGASSGACIDRTW